MKKKKFLPVLIGIFIPISAFTAEYTAVLDMIHADVETTANNTGQASTYAGEVSNNTRVMKNDIHNILSRVETIDNSTTSIAGTTDNIRSYLYDICYGKGNANGWFNSMYVLALDMQSKYNQLVSDLDDLYEHVSTTQNYQLEDIKTTNQTISDNTTSIKDTAKNIETSTDVIEGHTETIASDTTSLKTLLQDLHTVTMYRSTVAPSKASMDLKQPQNRQTVSVQGNIIDLLVQYLNLDSQAQNSLLISSTSQLMNLQAIRTNLAEIAKHVTSNTTDKVIVDTLPDITADLLPEYGINAATHDLPNVQENFTGDFHNDLLKLTRFNASVNISASYASISILTNLQSLLARNADLEEATQKESVQKGIEASQKELEGYEDDIESQQSTWAEYFRFKNENASKIMTQTPSFSSLTTDEMPQEISFTINDIKLSESSDTNHLMINHRLSAEEKDMLTVIRSCLTFFVWGVGVLASLWLYAMFIKLLGWACSLINPWAFETGSQNQLQLSSF